MKKWLFLNVPILLSIKVDGKDFWGWSNEIDPIGVDGGGSGSGGGIGGTVDEFNAGVDDTGVDFTEDNTGADFNTDSVGADFDVDNVGADSGSGRIGVDFDVNSSVGGNVAIGVIVGGIISLPGIISSIISWGGECTSTMLCCVLNFPIDWEMLSMEDVLDLLLLLMVPLYALMSSVKQFAKLICINYPWKRWEIIYRISIWFIHW